MMNIYTTICSNNYLAQANILGSSLKKYDPQACFILFLCDEKAASISYHNLFADEVITVADIEPRLPELAAKYSIVELNTCIKPRVMEYLFNERKAAKIIFLDPDIKVFASLAHLFDKLDSCTMLLTPHINTPVPLDGKTPSENSFLRFGLYNLGFLGLSNTPEAHRFLQWWKVHTYEQGYIDTYKGIFVDQLPVNHAPVFFKGVTILPENGLNMAPWNLHERSLKEIDGVYWVNGQEPLQFYHFSSFKPGLQELPLHSYNRFKLANRPDLQPLYQAYDDELNANGYASFSRITCSYAKLHQAYLKKRKKEKQTWGYLLKKITRH